MADVILWIALALLVGGVVGGFLPVLPGAAVSLVGLVVYAVGHGPGDLGWIPLFVLVGVAVVAMSFDAIATIASARYGGASTKTATIGLLVGLVSMLVLGPLGIVLGTAGAIFVIELLNEKPRDEALRAALYATVGILASEVVQIVLTATILLVFVLLVFVV